jgi:hypothetical protein
MLPLFLRSSYGMRSHFYFSQSYPERTPAERDWILFVALFSLIPEELLRSRTDLQNPKPNRTYYLNQTQKLFFIVFENIRDRHA